jgi:hypothetical protein
MFVSIRSSGQKLSLRYIYFSDLLQVSVNIRELLSMELRKISKGLAPFVDGEVSQGKSEVVLKERLKTLHDRTPVPARRISRLLAYSGARRRARRAQNGSKLLRKDGQD